MRKRIGILLVVLFVSLGLVACSKDPYEEMSMSLNKTEVNLTLVEDTVTNEIVGTPETITVEVDAPKNISKEIVLPAYGEGYGNEYVNITMETGEDGKYILKITAKKQGKTEIQVKTAEGNITQTIYVNIDVAVNSISFKDDALTAVEIGGSLDLNSIGRSFIDYKPSYTSQTDVEFYLSNDMVIDPDVVSWVKLENNVLSIDKSAVATSLPTSLKLVAKSKYNDNVVTDDLLSVKVVTPLDLSTNNIGAELVYMDNNDSEASVFIDKKSSGSSLLKYELTFASPYVDEGEVVDNNVINHSLIFGGTLNFYIKSTDYKIVYDGGESDVVDMFATTLTSSQKYNSAYEIQAKESGSYVAKFRIEYTGGTDNGQFDGMFTKNIEVTVNVINLPTARNILVNDKAYKNGENVIAVYDYYIGTKGSEFTISSSTCENLQYSLGTLEDGTMSWGAHVIGFDANDVQVSMSLKYSNGQIIYLKNGTDETTTITLKLTIYCNVYNDTYLSGTSDESEKDIIKTLQTYKKEIEVKLNLISGLEDITFDDSIVRDGFELDVVEDALGKVFYSFNEGVVAESVIRSISYTDTALFSYSFDGRHIILIPNSKFIEGSTTVTLYLTNGVNSGSSSPIVKVVIPYEDEVVLQINQDNAGFFAFGEIKTGNAGTGAGGVELTYYSEDFDSEDITNGVSEFYTRESGKKTFDKDGYTYTFDNFTNIVVSTWSDIEFDFYRLLIIDNEIKYTNKNTMKIESSDKTKLYWANGYLFALGSTTYNASKKFHEPIKLTLSSTSGDSYIIYVYIVNKIEEVSLSQSVFYQYVQNRIESALYLDQSRDLLEIKIAKLDKDNKNLTISDTNVKAGYYGNIHTDYTLIDASEVVFWFTDSNTKARVEITRQNIVHLCAVGANNGGYLQLLEALIDVDTQAYDGGTAQLYKEIFGTNGINFEFAGIVKQFDQEIPVTFSVNVKNPINTQSVSTNLDTDTGIYFEYDETSATANRYSFNYAVYPTNATFKNVFVEMKKVDGTSQSAVKIAVSYTKSSEGFINYKVYDAGSFNAEVYYEGEYETINVASTLDSCDFVIQIYGGKINIIQKQATPGTYILNVVRLDQLYFNTDVKPYQWSSTDPSTIDFNEANALASYAFAGATTYNLSIADGSTEATAFQIRSTNDLLAFLQTSATGKYYVIANDIYLSRKFTNSDTGYGYSNYIKELKNNLSGRFTKYYTDGKNEEFNRVIYGFTIELSQILDNMSLGLFTSVAQDCTLKYVTLGNLKIDVTTGANAVAINVGGLVGNLSNDKVEIIGAKVQGNINLTVANENSNVNIGGLVGKAEKDDGSVVNSSINSIPDESISVNNSDINANVAIQYIGKNANIGGVVGYAHGLEIDDVRAIPSIYSKESADGDYSVSNIGGIVGYAKDVNINDVVVYPILVGNTNIGGVAGLIEGGNISYAQVQMLYNVNMKTVIAGFDSVGGIIGKVNAVSSNQKTNLNYTYVRSYTTKDVNYYNTDKLDLNKFHTLYANNYYGAVVMLPSDNTSASIGGLVGVSYSDGTNADTLSIDYSYFMSHLVSFNNNTSRMAGIVGAFNHANNKMAITNSYVDGSLKFVGSDNDGDVVNYLCMNFLTSTIENSTPEILDTIGGTSSVTYSIKGGLNSQINSYALITQERVVSNVIVSYRAVYPNVITSDSSYLYARLNNSLFGLAPSLSYVRNIDPTDTSMGTETVSGFQYSGYTTTTERTTMLVANIRTGMASANIAMFAKKEVYQNTPSGNYYTAYALGSGNEIGGGAVSQIGLGLLAYFSEELANVMLLQQFYELRANGELLPRYLQATAEATLAADGDYEDIYNVLKNFSDITGNTTDLSTDEDRINKIVENLGSITTAKLKNAHNKDIVYMTRTIEGTMLETTLPKYDESSGVTMGGNFYVGNGANNGGYLYTSNHALKTYNGHTDISAGIVGEAENGRRFIMITGAPIALGTNVLKSNAWVESNEQHQYSKANIGAIFVTNGSIYGLNKSDNCIYQLVRADEDYTGDTFYFATSSTTYGGYIWDGDPITLYCTDGNEDNPAYYYFENDPKLIYISANASEAGYRYDIDDAGLVNIDGSKYTISYGQLVDVDTETPFNKENYSYGINTPLTIDSASTSLTNSKICQLYAAIDDFEDDLDIEYNDLDHIFKQYGFSNFNGERYSTSIAYELEGTAYYNEDDGYWYYDEEYNNIIKESTIIYQDGTEYKYTTEFNDIYFDGEKWYDSYNDIYFDGGRWYDSYSDEGYADPITLDSTSTLIPITTGYSTYNTTVTYTCDSADNKYYWLNSNNEKIVDIGTTYQTQQVEVGSTTYTLGTNGVWYDSDSNVVEDTSALANQTTTVTQYYRGYFNDDNDDGTWTWHFWDSASNTGVEIPEYLLKNLASEFEGEIFTSYVSAKDASAYVNEDGNFCKTSDHKQITKYLLLSDVTTTEDSTTATYTHIFYRRGEWYVDSEYANKVDTEAETDEIYGSGITLPTGLTQETAYGFTTNTGDKVVYYYNFTWYFDENYTKPIGNDISEFDELYDLSEYFYKEDTYYKLTGWYYDNEATRPVLDEKEINDMINACGGSSITYGLYDGVEYFKRYNWFVDEACTTLVSNDTILAILNTREGLANAEDGAHVLKQWYKDSNYTQPANDKESYNLTGLDIKLNKYTFEYNGSTHKVEIHYAGNGQADIKVDGVDSASTIFSKLFGSEGSNILRSASTAGATILIENNIISFVLPSSTGLGWSPSTIKISDTTFYVIATSTLKPGDNYTWLTSYKVNDGMPTLVTPIVNVSWAKVDSEWVSTLSLEYKLFYDELATFSIYAQPFEKTGNSYVANDNGYEHSAHIKKDDNTVVLMYNYSSSITDLTDVNTYKISFGERIDGYYFAQLNGLVVDLSAIKIDKESAMQLKITSSDKGVVEIEKVDNSDIFNVLVNGEGNAVITFYNLKDDSIKVSLNITVIKGFTSFQIYDDSENIKSELETYVGSTPTYYTIGLINNINGVEYQANQGGYFIEVISVDELTSGFDDDTNYSAITIGNYSITKDSIGKSYEFTSSNLSIQGDNCYDTGVIAIKITPYVVCYGEKLSLTDMAKNTYIYVYSAAKSIAFSEKEATIIPDGSKEIAVTIYSNKSDESLYVRINGHDIYWKTETKLDLNETIGTYLYGDEEVESGDGVESLLNVRLKSVQHIPEHIGKTLMYQHIYVFVLTMNIDVYRERTEKTGINAIAEGAFYEITVIPETNSNISSKFNLEISPLTASQVDVYLYPEVTDKSDPGDDEKHYWVNDFTSQETIIPNSQALFKFDVAPVYSNILALEVKVDARYSNYIKFQQIVPDYSKETLSGYNYKSIKDGNVQINNAYTLWDIPYQDGYFDSSNEWHATEWTFGEYFLMIDISENMPQGITLQVEVTGYDYLRRVIISKTIDVYVEYLPSLEISIDGESSVVYGFEEYVKLDISGRNTGEVTMSSNLTLYTYKNGSYEAVGSGADIVADIVIDINKQYYLYTGTTVYSYEIIISTERTIHGKAYSVKDSVRLQVVYVTIEKVRELNAINDIVTMKTGMYLGLEAVVETNKSDKINDLTFTVNGMSVASYIDDIEKQISGHTNAYIDNNFWQYFDGESYEQLTDSKTYPGFTFSRHLDIDTETLWRLNAVQIASAQLRLSFSYYYDENGVINICKLPENGPENGEELYVFEYVFTVNIKDGSTEDTPVPISSVEEFMNMQEGVNYILLTSLVLNNWKPMEFVSSYLDGNGFTITINSFDLSELKGSVSTVYAGLFSTINEGCMVKNLNIDVSPLLYSDSRLNKAINETIDPNIDLRLTSDIYFGTLTALNKGTIINVKIINTDTRKSGQTLYIGTTRGYFQSNGQSVTGSGRIGGLVSTNEGVIINSFVGINNNAQIERSAKSSNANVLVSQTVTISPFSLSGGNNIAGLVATNSGTITNCYVKNVNITNTTRMSASSATGGFVVENSGEIHSSAITSKNISQFRATDVTITSASITGGFAYLNSGEIQDAYTTAQINNNNVQTAGFVYKNTGSVKNAYTTSRNQVISDDGGNTLSHSLFVGDKSDYGTLENCYYAVINNELGEALSSGSDKLDILKSLDPAIPIQVNGEDVASEAMFTGFNFITIQDTYDGTWTIRSSDDGNIAGIFPQLEFAENLTYYSRRELSDIQSTIFEVIDSENVDVLNVDVLNVDVLDAEGTVLDSMATTQEYETIIFSHNNIVFQIDSDMTNTKISKVTDITASKAMEFVSEYQFEYKGFYYTIEPTYNGEPATSAEYKITITETDSAGTEITGTVSNFKFNYGLDFVLVKYVVSGSTSYDIYKVDSYSATKLTSGSENTFKYGNNTTYQYSYSKNNPGSLYNPIIVSNTTEFAKYIVTNTNEYQLKDGKKAYVFGLVANNGNGVNARYVQVASDIDFSNESINSKYEVNNSTSVIGVGDIKFNGVLLGNSMTLANINKVSYDERENYGIFETVGLTDDLRYEIAECNSVLLSEIQTSVVFDIDIEYNQFANTYANKVGLLAGTIANAVVSKIDIKGAESEEFETIEIAGKNLVGALAGLIIGEGDTTKISEITVEDVTVRADHNAIKNLKEDFIPTNISYSEFEDSNDHKAKYEELRLGKKEYSLDTYYYAIDNLSDISYAGAVAGAIISDSEINEDITEPKIIEIKYSVDDKKWYYYDSWKEITDTSWIPNLIIENGVSVISWRDNEWKVSISGGDWNKIDHSLLPTTYWTVIKENSLFDVADPNYSNLDTYSSYSKLREVTEFSHITDLKVSGSVSIKGDFAGGVIGYVGGYYNETRTTESKVYKRINYIDNLYFELTDDAEKAQSIVGYAYAGGIVGQAKDAYFTKAIVSHSEATQSEIDSNINNITADEVSSNTLFASGNHIIVGIGGIAGYTTDTWIVDSVSKVNVVNKNALIAGGVVGRADDEAYLAYTYTIGNVLGKNMIGGLMGYYFYDNNDFNLHMNNAFATNVWSSDITSLIKTNERAYTIYYNDSCGETTEDGWTDITYYTNDIESESGVILGSKTELKQATGVDIDAVLVHGINTMPELGNQVVGYDKINISEEEPKYCYKINILGTEFAVYFNQSTNFGESQFTFIGSVLGRSTSYNTTTDSANSELMKNLKFYDCSESMCAGDITKVRSDLVEIDGETTKEEYYMYYNENFFNVISSTYGVVKHTGTIDQGNYTSVINSDKLDLSHFDTNYDDSLKVTYNGSNYLYDGNVITDDKILSYLISTGREVGEMYENESGETVSWDIDNQENIYYWWTMESNDEGCFYIKITDKDILEYLNAKYPIEFTSSAGKSALMSYLGYADYNNTDINTYKQVFGKQAYLSYITGDFINTGTDAVEIGNKYYSNEFSKYYSFAYASNDKMDEYSEVNSIKEAIAEHDSKTFQSEITAGLDASTIWYVDVTKHVAQYGYNINGSFNLVAGEQALFEGFTYGESNKLYKLAKTSDGTADGDLVNNVFDMSSYMTSSAGCWYAPTKIGVNNNIYFAEESNPATIKFKLYADDVTASTVYRYGLFDTLVGCTFININFEIDLSNVTKYIATNNTEYHLGLFANVINGCTFTNCSFSFTNIPSESELKIYNEGATGNLYQVKDFGMVFGLVQNSTISNTNFNFDENVKVTYTRNNDLYDLYSYGLAIGQMVQTSLINININQNRSVYKAYAVISNGEEIIDGTVGTLEWYSVAPEYVESESQWKFRKDDGDGKKVDMTEGEISDFKLTDLDILAQLPITGVSTGDSALYYTYSTLDKKSFNFIYNGADKNPDNAKNIAEYNFGGLVGLSSSSRVETINYTASSTQIELKGLQTTLIGNKSHTFNAGGFIGKSVDSLAISNVNYNSSLTISNLANADSAGADNVTTLNAGVIGQLNTTNISAFNVVDSSNTIQILTRAKTLNGGIIGLSSGAGNTIDSLINEQPITINSLYSTELMSDTNVGAITGREDYASMYTNVINSGKLSVVVTASGVNTLNVGGFVGYMNRGGDFNTCYNIGDITIEDAIAGKTSGAKNNSAVNVGGIVGKNNNQKAISMTAVINYGDIYYKDVDNSAYYIGGLVGYNSNKELNLTCTLSLGNFIRTDDYSTNYFAPTYASSKVYSRINAMANSVSKNSKWTESYYISEHDPVSSQDATNGMTYSTGNTWENFMVSAGRTYTKLLSTTTGSFTSDNKLRHDSATIISQLPYVVGLDTSYINSKATEGSKYNPKYVTALTTLTLTTSTYKYIVLGGTATVEPVSDGEKFYGSSTAISSSLDIGVGQVITCADTTGSTRYYVKYSSTLDSDYKPFIATNKGVISNILFVLDFASVDGKEYDGITMSTTGDYALLMNTNYGYMMNTGVTQHNENGIELTVTSTNCPTLSVVKENKGGVFTSGTSITFTNTTSIPHDFEMSYFVGNNYNVIVNSYTTSTLNAIDNVAYYNGYNWYYDASYTSKITNTAILNQMPNDSLMRADSEDDAKVVDDFKYFFDGIYWHRVDSYVNIADTNKFDYDITTFLKDGTYAYNSTTYYYKNDSWYTDNSYANDKKLNVSKDQIKTFKLDGQGTYDSTTYYYGSGTWYSNAGKTTAVTNTTILSALNNIVIVTNLNYAEIMKTLVDYDTSIKAGATHTYASTITFGALTLNNGGHIGTSFYGGNFIVPATNTSLTKTKNDLIGVNSLDSKTGTVSGCYSDNSQTDDGNTTYSKFFGVSTTNDQNELVYSTKPLGALRQGSNAINNYFTNYSAEGTWGNNSVFWTSTRDNVAVNNGYPYIYGGIEIKHTYESRAEVYIYTTRQLDNLLTYYRSSTNNSDIIIDIDTSYVKTTVAINDRISTNTGTISGVIKGAVTFNSGFVGTNNGTIQNLTLDGCTFANGYFVQTNATGKTIDDLTFSSVSFNTEAKFIGTNRGTLEINQLHAKNTGDSLYITLNSGTITFTTGDRTDSIIIGYNLTLQQNTGTFDGLAEVITKLDNVSKYHFEDGAIIGITSNSGTIQNLIMSKSSFTFADNGTNSGFIKSIRLIKGNDSKEVYLGTNTKTDTQAGTISDGLVIKNYKLPKGLVSSNAGTITDALELYNCKLGNAIVPTNTGTISATVKIKDTTYSVTDESGTNLARGMFIGTNNGTLTASLTMENADMTITGGKDLTTTYAGVGLAIGHNDAYDASTMSTLSIDSSCEVKVTKALRVEGAGLAIGINQGKSDGNSSLTISSLSLLGSLTLTDNGNSTTNGDDFEIGVYSVGGLVGQSGMMTGGFASSYKQTLNIGTNPKISPTITVGGSNTRYVGTVAGLLRETILSVGGGSTTMGGTLEVKSSNFSYALGGFIGYCDLKSTCINMGNSTVGVSITLESGANASAVGGIFGTATDDETDKFTENGVQSELTYNAKMDCTGLSQSAVSYNNDWWTNKTETTLQTITNQSDGRAYAINNEWRFLGIVRGCTIKVGFIYGSGTNPGDNCTSHDNASMVNIKATAEGMFLQFFHAKKKDSCEPYISSGWANDECIIIECWKFNMSLANGDGKKDIYDHIYFTTHSNYQWDLWDSDEVWTNGYKEGLQFIKPSPSSGTMMYLDSTTNTTKNTVVYQDFNGHKIAVRWNGGGGWTDDDPETIFDKHGHGTGTLKFKPWINEWHA